MEPASITGLIGFSLDSIALIYKFVTGVKDASQTVSKLQQELDSLKTVLDMLGALLKRDESENILQQTSALFKAANKCNRELRDLQHTLDGVSKGHVMWRVFHKLKWPLEEDDTVRVVESLNRYVTVFQLSLTVDGL
jgi:Fungal N-terminal domain of STAND proteins